MGLAIGDQRADQFGAVLHFPESLREGDHPGWGFSDTVGADILFIISLFVLEADFWGKLWSLFNYNAWVVVEET